MKHSKIIELEESTILTLSVRALQKKLKFKPFVEQILTELAKTIETQWENERYHKNLKTTK